ncbi:MAG: TolC family protein [Bacteroidales bacterium]|nr:TolC family protein [Bacteroidales bacterium]MDD3201414.1 TolC family protein [Bacteroidales bacterium]
MKRVSLVFLMLIILTQLYAQTEEKSLYNLNDCMIYAIEHSTKVVKQSYANSNYEQDRLAALTSLFPYIGANSSTTTSYGRSIDPETNTYTTSANFGNSLSASTSMTVFNGLSGINSYRASRIAYIMGGEMLQQVKDQVALEVMQAYFDAVYYSEAIILAQQQLETSKKTFEKDSKLEKLGLKSRADVLQIEAQYRGDEYTVIKQENARDLAVSSLKEKMNYPADEPIEIDTRVFVDPEDEEVSLKSLTDYAMQHNPNLKAQKLSFRQSQLNYYATRGRMLPSISVGAGYSSSYYENLNATTQGSPYWQQLRDNQGYYWGASISIPIFNGLTRRTAARKAKNNMKIAEQDMIAAERALQGEIETNYNQMRGYRKEYIQTNIKVDAADLAHKATLQKYDQGVSSPIDLQTSANQLLQAKAEMLNARLQYIIKSRMVDYYNGKPLIR